MASEDSQFFVAEVRGSQANEIGYCNCSKFIVRYTYQGGYAAEALAQAVVRAVRAAEAAGGLPAINSLLQSPGR